MAAAWRISTDILDVSPSDRAYLAQKESNVIPYDGFAHMKVARSPAYTEGGGRGGCRTHIFDVRPSECACAEV